MSSDNFSKNDYYRISNIVRNFIIKNKIKSLPVDLDLVVNNNSWFLISYAQLDLFPYKIDNLILQSNWGFSFHINNTNIIFYDDKISHSAQRFTIAHEIGHITLQHFLLDKPNSTIEKEANMFATRLLMPLCVLYETNINSQQEIVEMCDVSNKCADYRLQRLQLVKTRDKFYTDKLEYKVFKNFKKYIKNYIKKVN